MSVPAAYQKSIKLQNTKKHTENSEFGITAAGNYKKDWNLNCKIKIGDETIEAVRWSQTDKPSSATRQIIIIQGRWVSKGQNTGLFPSGICHDSVTTETWIKYNSIRQIPPDRTNRY